MSQNRIIIGISGASGAIFGIRALELLKSENIETHLVISPSAGITIAEETDFSLESIRVLADHYYSPKDMGAAISSGSFKTLGMLVAPCSMRSLAEIATGVTTGLISRAADVILKERRKLVLLTRETPLTAIHLKNMLSVTQAGGIIAPPVPAFYHRPENLDDLVNQTVGRALDLFDLNLKTTHRWRESDGSVKNR